MHESTGVQVESDGSVVLPASFRAQRQWVDGTPRVALKTELGLLLADQQSVEWIVRRRLAEVDLVRDLLTDRRREAAAE